MTEKEAIDILKDFTENEDTKYCYDWQGFDYETILSAIECLLNLIDKKQKEIEEYKELVECIEEFKKLKRPVMELVHEMNKFEDEFISKDKIREILFSIGTLYDGGFVKVEFIRKKLEGLLEE